MNKTLLWVGTAAVVLFLISRSKKSNAANPLKDAAQKNLVKTDKKVKQAIKDDVPSVAPELPSLDDAPSSEPPTRIEPIPAKQVGVHYKLEYAEPDAEGVLRKPEPSLQTPSEGNQPKRRRRSRSAAFDGNQNDDLRSVDRLLILDNTPFPISVVGLGMDVDCFDEGGGL